MKKQISIIVFTLFFFNIGQSARIITNFDIARWYLDADLVLICTVKQIDTLNIRHHDSLSENNFNIHYDVIKEKYQIKIDSIIKQGKLIDEITNIIFTPEFLINYTESQIQKKQFAGFNSQGDSTFLSQIKINSNNYLDDTYFRIKDKKTHVVILKKEKSDFIINYQSNLNEDILNLIKEVNIKGETYFPTPKN